MPADLLNLLPDVVAFGLTLAVFSFLIGDNPLYRIAVHIFVGAAAGYAGLVVYYNVIYPQLVGPLLAYDFLGPGLPLAGLILALFLVLKSQPATNRLGSLATAFMVGVGSAVAVGGAVTGTIFPQTEATFVSLMPVDAGGLNLEKLVESVVFLAGTLATLGFFYYGARPQPGGPAARPRFLMPVIRLGQIFIGIAFGIMYAGVLAASLAFFVERLSALWAFLQSFM